MHHTKPATVFQGSQSIRLGAGGANRFCHPLELAPNAHFDTLGPLEDCSGLRVVHIEMAKAVELFGSTRMLDSSTRFQRLDFHGAGARCSIARAEKGGTQNFHKQSMANLWKSFNNILWTTDDSAICRIDVCGDPDFAIAREKLKEEACVLNA